MMLIKIWLKFNTVKIKMRLFTGKLKITLWVACLCCINSFSFSQKIQKVDALSIPVSDMREAERFYSEVLTFKKIDEYEVYSEGYEKLYHLFGTRIHIVRMQLGNQYIELTDFLTQGGKPVPVDAASNDQSFQHIAIVVSDMDKAYERLRSYHVNYVSTAPQTIPVSNKAAAGIRAFYFQDPDRHNLELIWFPAGKGNPVWQQNKKDVFLGIDHTAIAVISTDASRKFYETVLGLQLKGESFNSGTEQAHLNNVENASLHISGLGAMEGPGVEFLEYLTPGKGKRYPVETRMDDLLAWKTILIADDVAAVYIKLKETHADFVSAPVATQHLDHFIYQSAFIVKDPDGHLLMICGK